MENVEGGEWLINIYCIGYFPSFGECASQNHFSCVPTQK